MIILIILWVPSIDDDDDDDDDELFLLWLTDVRCLALFPVRTIVRDPHHLESPTCYKQDLNLSRSLVQALLNEVVQ